jgi:uracil-DNA glycosylase
MYILREDFDISYPMIGDRPGEQMRCLLDSTKIRMSLDWSSRISLKIFCSDGGGVPIPTSGNLDRWAHQGVLLLNATLTVEAGQAGSHQGKGWESFTDAIIKTLSDKREHLVFMLWGRYAQQKASLIDASRHLILQAPHPSPFSAHSGFFGCKHFSKANEYLKRNDLETIKW